MTKYEYPVLYIKAILRTAKLPSLCNVVSSIYLLFVPCFAMAVFTYMYLHYLTSSNHRLESAGLNALEDLLFKMLGMSRKDSNAYLVCKRNWIPKDHLF